MSSPIPAVSSSVEVCCPSCGEARPLFLGPSVFADWAENVEVAELRHSSGGLYRCAGCRLVFRFPIPSPQELRAAYEAFPLDSWDYEEPTYWKWAIRCIEELAPNRQVLDVGCFRGDFLEKLGPTFERCGIEPNPQAAEKARSRGIQVVGTDAGEELPGREQAFGAIVLMDVAEHVPDPAKTLAHLSRYLAPGGIVLVLTGNADHMLARASLPFYWYMSFPIHLVYLGKHYLRWLEKPTGLKPVRWLTFAHKNFGPLAFVRDWAKGLILLAWKRGLGPSRLGAWLRRLPLFRRIDARRTPPLLFCVGDHIGVALQKTH